MTTLLKEDLSNKKMRYRSDLLGDGNPIETVCVNTSQGENRVIVEVVNDFP